MLSLLVHGQSKAIGLTNIKIQHILSLSRTQHHTTAEAAARLMWTEPSLQFLS